MLCTSLTPTRVLFVSVFTLISPLSCPHLTYTAPGPCARDSRSNSLHRLPDPQTLPCMTCDYLWDAVGLLQRAAASSGWTQGDARDVDFLLPIAGVPSERSGPLAPSSLVNLSYMGLAGSYLISPTLGRTSPMFYIRQAGQLRAIVQVCHGPLAAAC